MNSATAIRRRADAPIRSHLIAFLASSVAIGVLVSLYLTVQWSNSGDWRGYLILFHNHGGWLAQNDRDPAFVALLTISEQLFGPTGYIAWRNTLFATFMVGILYIGVKIPPQRRATFLCIIFVLLCAFFLKSLVQIRECLASLVFMIGAAPVFSGTKTPIQSLPYAIAAALIHSGTSGILICLVASLILSELSVEKLLSGNTQKIIFVGSIFIGVILAIILNENAGIVISTLTDRGSDTISRFRNVALKYVYWTGLGIVALLIRSHTINALKGQENGRLFGIFIASALLPALYFAGATLNLLAFQANVVTGLFGRALSTTMEVCLLIVLWRGRGNYLTLALAIVILSDRIRAMWSFLGHN